MWLCALKIDPVIRVRCLLFQQGQTKGDYHGQVCSVEEPLKVVRHVLERLGLELNETKTQIVDATEASFNFLGFSIQSNPKVCARPVP